jgi:dTDP-4-amino-4,6-dideoxygalactose transaminase
MVIATSRLPDTAAASPAKRGVNELALFGGQPAFADMLHVGRPNIGDRERLFERLNDVLDNRWLTNAGPYVQELERRVADYIGVKHCVAMCNGTIALEIAIRAAGLSGEVIVPSFTFIATPHALQWQEITPVFADVDPATHNLDPASVERMITPRTSGIIGVHVWGRPCAIEELERIAKRNNLKLLFDAAHGFACSHNGRMIGSFGLVEMLSFHATKFFNSFEGGALVTNDDELAKKARLMKNFGFSGEYDSVIHPGTNGKMTEVCAAMGLTSLESLDDFIAANYANYRAYREELRGIPGIKLQQYDESERQNFQYIVLEVDPDVTHVTRDELVEILHAERVLARRYFYPGCHQMQPYRSYFPHAGMLLQNTERLVQRVMSLPTGTAVDAATVRRICELIRFAVENADELRAALNRRGPAERKASLAYSHHK